MARINTHQGAYEEEEKVGDSPDVIIEFSLLSLRSFTAGYLGRSAKPQYLSRCGKGLAPSSPKRGVIGQHIGRHHSLLRRDVTYPTSTRLDASRGRTVMTERSHRAMSRNAYLCKSGCVMFHDALMVEEVESFA